jgi:hypothetical protein
VPKHRERFLRACETSRRVQVGTRLDRSEFIGRLHGACHEARELGARYAIAEAAATHEHSGAYPTPAATAASAEASGDLTTPVFWLQPSMMIGE